MSFSFLIFQVSVNQWDSPPKFCTLFSSPTYMFGSSVHYSSCIGLLFKMSIKFNVSTSVLSTFVVERVLQRLAWWCFAVMTALVDTVSSLYNAFQRQVLVGWLAIMLLVLSSSATWKHIAQVAPLYYIHYRTSHIEPWRWKEYVSPKRWHRPTKPHGAKKPTKHQHHLIFCVCVYIYIIQISVGSW
jgi:hypothetical protein